MVTTKKNTMNALDVRGYNGPKGYVPRNIKILTKIDSLDQKNTVKARDRRKIASRDAKHAHFQMFSAFSQASELLEDIGDANIIGRVGAALDEVQATAAKFGDLPERVTKVLSTLEELAAKMAPAVDSFAAFEKVFSGVPLPDSFMGFIKEMLKDPLNMLKALIGQLPAIFAAHPFASIASLIAVVVWGIATFAYKSSQAAVTFGAWAFEQLQKFFGQTGPVETKVEFQALTEGFLTTIAKVLAALTFFVTGAQATAREWKDIPWGKLLDMFRLWKPSVEGVASVMQAVYDGFVWLVNQVFTILGVDVHLKYVQTGIDQFDAIVEECQELYHKHVIGKLMFTNETYAAVHQLVQRLDSFLATYKTAANSAVGQRLPSVRTTLSRLLDAFKGSDFMIAGYRVEPVSILLTGRPGVGKSTLVEYLHNSLGSQLVDPSLREQFKQDPTKFMYNRCQENVYWEGYSLKSTTVVFDDFGQQPDSRQNLDSEPMNIIRAANAFPYQLHMAEMSQKANSYFRSPLIIATSNLDRFNFESVREAAAVGRRFDFAADVYVAPKYARENVLGDSVLDPEKLPLDAEGHTYVPSDAFIFRVYDPVLVMTKGEKRYKGECDYGGFVDKVAQKLQEKRERFKAQRAYAKTLIGDMCLEDPGSMEERLRDPDTMGDLVDPFTVSEDALRSECFAHLSADIDDVVLEGELEHIEMEYKEHFDALPLVVRQAFHWASPPGISLTSGEQEGYKFRVTQWRLLLRRQSGNFAHFLPVVDDDAGFVRQLFGYLYDCHYITITSHWWLFACQMRAILEISRERPFFKEGMWASYWARFVTESTYAAMSLPQRWRETAFSLPGFFWSNLFHRVTITAVIGVSTAVAGTLVAWYRREHAIPAETQSVGASGKSHALRTYGKSQRAHAVPKKALQMGDEGKLSAAEAFARGILRANLRKVTVVKKHRHLQDSEHVASLGYVLGIVGKYYLGCAHFPHKLVELFEGRDTSDYHVRLSKQGMPGPSHNDEFIPLREFIESNFYPSFWEEAQVDLLVYHFPSVGCSVRDIRDKFCDGRTLETYCRVQRSAYFPVFDQLQGHMELPIVPMQVPRSYAIRVDDVVLRKVGITKCVTRVGDCGRVLVPVDQVGGKHAVVGMHFAGSGTAGEGYFSVLKREEIEEAIEGAIDAFDSVPVSEPIAESQMGPLREFYGRFEVLDVLKKPPASVTWSKLRRTKAVFPPREYQSTKRPALLRKVERGGVTVDPWANALEKYCTPALPLPLDVLQDAADVLSSRFHSVFAREPLRLFTFEEACAGLAGDPWFTSIDRNTSAGFPWILEKITRKDMFGVDGDFDFSTDACAKVRADVDLTISMAKKAQRRLHIFKDCLKDELRPLEKVVEGKTRLFSACPLTLLLTYRMYFGDFCRWFNSANVEIGSGVGIDPLGPSWTHIAEDLCARAGGAKGICAGDYSRYDGSEKPQIHNLILGIVEDMYRGTEEDRMVRKVLWLELTNSRHAMWDTVYEWPSSLPSGHPMTAIVNTMYNHIAFIAVWTLLSEIYYQPFDAYDFYQNVSFYALGDDNIWSCSPEVREWFNHEQVSEAMQLLGLTYTDETKDGASKDLFRDIGEVTFLKRGFSLDVKESPYWRAPLEFPSILERVFWWRKSPLGETALALTNAQEALYELAVHGPRVFAHYAPLVVEAVSVYGNLEFMTYAACKRKAGWIFSVRGHIQPDDWLPTPCDEDETVHQADGFQSGTSLGVYPYAQVSSGAALPKPVKRLSGVRTMTGSVRLKFAVPEQTNEAREVSRTDPRDTGFGNIGVNFVDAEVTEMRVGQSRPVPRVLIDKSAADNHNTIEDFFGRPYVYNQGNLTSTDGPTTFPRTWNLTSILSQTYYLQKLQGYAGMRATLVVRLQVNANRFQQGRYILAWLPSCGADADPIWSGQRVYMSAYSKTQITQLPHVELDINCDTEAILRIPYVSNTLYYPFSSCQSGARVLGDIGNFFLYPYSPLVSAAGSTTAGYTVWVHFEEIELVGSATFQMGDVQEEERRENKMGGVISGPLMKVSKSASILSEIPMLSSVAQPTSWMANVLARAASVFGFSSPSKLEATVAMTPFPVMHMNASDVPRVAQSMGHTQNNAVMAVPGLSGTDLDEMSFGYLMKIPAYLYTYTWTESQAVGTLIANVNNGAAGWYNSQSDGTWTLINRAPFAFITAMFGQWRGSVEFTFKFVKTEFHTGRLAFAYYPYVADGLNSPTATPKLDSYVYREVVDIRYCNEFRFRCPYVAPTPWIHTGTGGTAGSIYITVVDPLVAPATVSSTVTILVEANAGPDFEVAGLPVANLQPAIPASYQMGHMDNDTSPAPCEVETYEVDGIAQGLYYSAISAGERVNSFRQLAKKYYMIPWYNFAGSTIYPDLTAPAAYLTGIYPTACWFITTVLYVNGSIDQFPFSDLFSILSATFGYFRGGVRLRLSSVTSQGEGATLRYVASAYATPNGQPPGVVAPVQYGSSSTGVHSIPPFNSYLSNFAIFNDEATGGVDIHVPPYVPKLFRATGNETWVATDSSGALTWATPALNANQVSPVAITVTAGSSQFQSQWFRSIADDGEFGRFISFPPTLT